MDLLTKFMPSVAADHAASEPLPVEVTALQEEVRRLRQDRSNKEAGEASLLNELQKRCDRVIALETNLDAAQAQVRRLQQEREKHAAEHAELVAVVTGRTEEAAADLVPILVGMKARLATLEQARKDGKRVAVQNEEELVSLRKQVEELKRVVVAGGGSGDKTKTPPSPSSSLPSAAELGLPEDVRLLLQKCPWTEAVLGNTLVTETVYEWEGWSLFHGWSGAQANLSQSTPQLQDLVLRCSTASSMPSTRVDKTITDASFAALVDPETLALPAVGWEWLGGWKVDDVGRGEGGWSYGFGPEDLIKGQGSDSPVVVEGEGGGGEVGSSSTKKRRVRRRRWVRVRVLSCVPGASDMVNAFLSLRAKVASLETLTHKLSEQVLALQSTVNDREAQAVQAVVLERKRVASQFQQELARQQGEAKLRQALEGRGEEGGGGGSVKAVGEAVSKWFAGLGDRPPAGEEEEGGKEEGDEEQQAASGSLKKWFSKESFDKVKASLGSSSGSIVTDASSSSSSLASDEVPAPAAAAAAVQEEGGGGGGGPPPLIVNALKWFHKEVIQQPHPADNDDPIESWADEVGTEQGEEEEEGGGEVEHLTEEEKAALQKQLDEADKEKENDKEKETATVVDEKETTTNKAAPGAGKKKKNKKHQQPPIQEAAGRKGVEMGMA